MKTIYLVRHGKSSWRHHEGKDIERPLKKKGREDGEKMSRHLLDKYTETGKGKPQLFISSPAKRALETAGYFAQAFGIDEQAIQVNKSLYSASREELLAVILGLDADVNSVLIIGHDPGLSNLASFLTRQEIEKVPTSGVMCIDFDTDSWKNIQEDTGHIRFFVYPKLLV